MSLNATTILGPGGFSRIPVDVYDATKTYKAGEYRNHDGIIYKAIVDIDTAEAWNSAHWVVSEPVNESAVKMVTALNAIADAMQPANVYLDLEVSLLASDWTVSSPYEYTWTNSHVTSECEVEVFFGDGADASVVKYLWYEKAAGGVKFTAPTKPNSNIPVVIRIINAKADFVVSDLTASQIYTEAITGVSNVEEGLENLDERSTGLEDGVAYRLGNTNTTGGTLATGTYIYVDGNVTLSTGMYKASTAINNGDTLSLSNLSPVPGGVANEINSKIGTVPTGTTVQEQISILNSGMSWYTKSTQGSSAAVVFDYDQARYGDRYTGLVFATQNSGGTSIYAVGYKGGSVHTATKLFGSDITISIGTDTGDISVSLGHWSRALLLVDIQRGCFT